MMDFFKSDSAGGVVLFLAAVAAIVAANTPALREWYLHFQHFEVGVLVGEGNVYSLSLLHFVNDGLMAVFFLLVGLEIKRELLQGELASRKRAALPALAAVGGMALPALIFVVMNRENGEVLRGWAIPTATDIAFSLGVLSLLGARVPLSVKVFLTAVAIIDDLGAIAIIAFFYTAKLHLVPLALAGAVLAVLFVMNRRVYGILPYVFGFLLLWIFMSGSGVHSTLAGVAAAFAVPLRALDGTRREPTLVRLEHGLHSTVTFAILPLFAFVNAGVSFENATLGMLTDNLPLGIALGLVVGKAVGISAAVWLGIRCGVADMPKGCGWMGVVGIALLCGIGFTVSLFIGNLSFSDADTINAVKMGVLMGSVVAGGAGFAVLRFLAFREVPGGGAAGR